MTTKFSKALLGTAVAAGLSVLASTASCAATAQAVMKGPDGRAMGTVTLKQTPHGILISADMKGLSPGAHGFHVHAVGACGPNFKAAGGHFNPDGKGHGFTEKGPHAGDNPNIFANAGGAVRADILNDRIALTKGPKNSLFDTDGSAIIVHAKADTYGEKPGAGGRVACGVINAN